MYNVWVEPIERRDERKKGEGVMPRAGTLTFLSGALYECVPFLLALAVRGERRIKGDGEKVVPRFRVVSASAVVSLQLCKLAKFSLSTQKDCCHLCC